MVKGAFIALAVALALPTGALAMDSDLPSHIELNIDVSVKTAQAGAVVTVLGVAGESALLKVEESVMATLPSQLTVPAAGLYKGDLTPGARLLVFFNRRGADAWVPTGRYELITDGKIRDVPAALYLAETRAAAAAAAEAEQRSSRQVTTALRKRARQEAPATPPATTATPPAATASNVAD